MNAQLPIGEETPKTEAYRVPRHPGPIDLRLDGNEGQVVSPSILDALSQLEAEQLRRYPSCGALEAQIAQLYSVSPDQVLVTAGADDGLLRMCRAYLSPTESLVLPVPTFEMIERFAGWCFAPVRRVPWTEPDYPVDAVIAAVDAQTSLVAVVSPNNPTGGVISSDELIRLSEALPDQMLMVDGAYAEFADDDITEVALQRPNAVVFRTLSKALGLAGLRVGFAVGPAPVIERLRAFGMPYPVSAPSLRLASEGLARQAESEGYLAQVKVERRNLTECLTALGQQTTPSQGNFLLTRGIDPLWWRDCLAGLGIGVRVWPRSESLGDAMRVTCPGSAPEYDRLERALNTIAAPQAILFDVDGVLVDVSASYRAAIIETASSFGVQVTNDDIERCKQAGQANNDWIVTQRLLKDAGVERDLETVTERFELLYWGDGDTPGLYRSESFIGDPERLRALAARYPIAAVTGRPKRDALHVLERFGVLNCFSAVITMEDAPAKPSPRPVELALERLGVNRAWMLGDTRDDIDAARAAGVLPFGTISPGKTSLDDRADHLLSAGAARVFSDWMSLEAYLP